MTVATQRREQLEALCPAAPQQILEPHVRVMKLVEVRVGQEDVHLLAPIRRHIDSFGAVPAHFAVVVPMVAVAKNASATILDFPTHFGIVNLMQNASVLHHHDSLAPILSAKRANCREQGGIVDDQQSLFL